ncbi:MAG: cysteine desulfurase NifS [Armatimonadetes bacterium]|nr:cysteine desulfurase NifS [Armatimonadota bacterium]
MIYLDHSATTPVAPEVREAMLPYLTEDFGNPSSIYYELGRRAHRAVDDARGHLAAFLGAKPEEIIFTGGGTEADNLAIKGVAWALRDRGRHIITSAIEHHAVLHACQALEREDFRVTVLPVDEHAVVSPDALVEAFEDDTILVTIMHANNEVGTLQDLVALGALCHERGVLFHTDAVQSFGKVPLDLSTLPVDLLSISAHKFYGPKGVGALWVRSGVRLLPVLDGGGQERGLRSGTHNVAGIVGMARAVQLVEEAGPAEVEREAALCRRLIQGVLDAVPHSFLTGHPDQRLPNIASFCIPYVEGEAMLLALDQEGICASTGSACSSGSLDPSHVLLAMGIPPEVAHGSLRLSLGRGNTDEDVDRVLQVLPGIVERLRAMSPVWADARRRGEV